MSLPKSFFYFTHFSQKSYVKHIRPRENLKNPYAYKSLKSLVFEISFQSWKSCRPRFVEIRGLPKTVLYVRQQKTTKNKCSYSNVLGKSLNPSNVLDKSFFSFLKTWKFFGGSVIVFKTSVLKVLKSLKFLNLVF